jgi:hypothetical protein
LDIPNTITAFLYSELENIGLKLSSKENGREGVDFLIGTNEFFLQPLC